MRTQGTRHLNSQFQGSGPWVLWANCMSQGRIIPHFMWISHRLVSLNKPTRYTSVASHRAPMAIPWNCMFDLKSWVFSQTSLWKDSLWMMSSVIFWYLWISLIAMMPGLNQHGCKVASVSGTCLPPHEGDFCSCVALLGPTDPFCFVFFTWVCCLRASHHSHQASLACWPWPEKCPWVLLIELHLGLLDPLPLPEFHWALPPLHWECLSSPP